MADGNLGCVPKKEAEECLFKLFFYLVEEDGIMLLKNKTGHYRKKTCALLCLDVNFFMSLAVIAW